MTHKQMIRWHRSSQLAVEMIEGRAFYVNKRLDYRYLMADREDAVELWEMATEAWDLAEKGLRF